MPQDPVDGAIQFALNSPRNAVVFLCILGAFGLGYYLRGHPGAAGTPPTAAQDNVSVHFSPNGGCTDTVVGEIRGAKQTILVQSYSFTSKSIVPALVDAQHRGVKVTLVIDKKAAGEPGSKAAQAAEGGIEVLLDGKHSIAHNKIMLIDGRTIVTGSFNFTNQAEHNNAENLVVIKDKPDLFAGYERNFRDHLAHSDRYSGR